MNIALIGLGNILLRDEGVGVHVVNVMREKYTFSPEIEILDGGTMGLDLLPFIEGRDRIIIVDAVDFGKEPGHIGIVEDGDIPYALRSKLSVHHIGLSDVIFAIKLMDKMPPKMCLIGIQPDAIEVGLDVTETVKSRIQAIIDLTIRTLEEWNITCALQSPQKSLV